MKIVTGLKRAVKRFFLWCVAYYIFCIYHVRVRSEYCFFYLKTRNRFRHKIINIDVSPVKSIESIKIPTLTVVCVSYKRYEAIHTLIHSFLNQTIHKWKLLVIHDGPDETMMKIVNTYAQHDLRISYAETSRRFNDFGYSLRQQGLEVIDSEYVLFTNDDNYYTPTFLDYMLKAVTEYQLDFIYCDLIHSHQMPGIYSQSDYMYFFSMPTRGMIDVGNFIVKTSIAKSISFKDKKGHNAEGVFVDALIKEYWNRIRIGKLNKVLFVHN